MAAFNAKQRITINNMKRQSTQHDKVSHRTEYEMKIDALVEQTKIEDELFINQGVNNDELQDALMYYKRHKDPEIEEAMADGMANIRREF